MLELFGCSICYWGIFLRAQKKGGKKGFRAGIIQSVGHGTSSPRQALCLLAGLSEGPAKTGQSFHRNCNCFFSQTNQEFLPLLAGLLSLIRQQSTAGLGRHTHSHTSQRAEAAPRDTSPYLRTPRGPGEKLNPFVVPLPPLYPPDAFLLLFHKTLLQIIKHDH